MFKQPNSFIYLAFLLVLLMISSPCLQAMEEATSVSLLYDWEACPPDLEKYPFNEEGKKALITDANNGDRAAQDEIVRRFDLGLIYANPKEDLPGFLTWQNLEDRIVNQFGYASLFFHRFTGMFGEENPALAKTIETALNKAASQGNMRAKLSLAIRDPNTFSEEEWFKILEKNDPASKAMSPEIQYILGKRGLDRIFNSPNKILNPKDQLDLSRPLALLTQAAEKGYVKAQHALGEFYFRYYSYALPQDGALVVKWLTLAANQCHAESAFLLGEVYNNNNFFPDINNRVLANTWYAQAAEQGHVTAQLRMGMGYYEEQDYEKAFKTLEKLKDVFHLAKYTLAKMYYAGKGVDPDYEKAFKYFNEVVKSKSLYYKIKGKADYYLSLMYWRGDGTNEDKSKSAQYLLASAKFGHKKRAYVECSNMYAEGDGIKKNYAEALRWAFKSGDAERYRKLLTQHFYLNISKRISSSGKEEWGPANCILSENTTREVNQMFSSWRSLGDQTEVEEEAPPQGNMSEQELEKNFREMLETHKTMATRYAPDSESTTTVFSVPTLCNQFKILTGFEQLCLETLKVYDENKKKTTYQSPFNITQCFTTVLSPHDDMRQHIHDQQEPRYISLDTIGEVEYLTFGEESCTFVKRAMALMNGFDEYVQTWNSLRKYYEQAYFDTETKLVRLHGKISVLAKKPEKAESQKGKLEKLKSKLADESELAQDLEQQVHSFTKQKPVIEELKLFSNCIMRLIRGASSRNTAFLEELASQ